MAASKDVSTNVNAEFLIKPELSQTALITILLIAAFSLSVGLFFLWYDKNYSWIPITISLFLIVISFIGWWHSQKMIDMGNSSPTHISDSEGNKIITDTRALESNNVINNIGVLFQTIGSRQRLPEPDGLVDTNGNLVPNSKLDAKSKVDKINETISKATDDFIKSPLKEFDGVEQKTFDLPSEAFEGILEQNKIETNK